MLKEIIKFSGVFKKSILNISRAVTMYLEFKTASGLDAAEAKKAINPSVTVFKSATMT